MAKRRLTTTQKDAAFLSAIAEGRTVHDACAVAGYTRDHVYVRTRRDPEWRRLWQEAKEIATEAMEAELDRRAFQGVERPIMYRGVAVATVREYSDDLALARLRALAPDKYRERQSVEVTGARLTLMALLAPARQRVEPSGLLDDN